MNPEHFEVVKEGSPAIRAWRESNPAPRFKLRGAALIGDGRRTLSGLTGLNGRCLPPNLSAEGLRGADLSGADLRDVRFWLADLTGADLSGADLTGADLSKATLTDANLDGANLTNVNFHGVNLDGANLHAAELFFTNFHLATLHETQFASAQLGAVSFAQVDLSTARGLERTTILGPCTIGLDTIYRSKGQIPQSFLAACGAPDPLIKYIPSLLGSAEPIQFYSCFISFSFKDAEFCQRLHSRMRDQHLRVWFAPEDMPGGKKVHEVIENKITVYDKLLLVLSEASMASEWVKTEIYHARQREIKESKRILFPIRLVPFDRIREWKAFDADIGKDMAREVREFYVPDFTHWTDHDVFEAEFKKLLRDLRASA